MSREKFTIVFTVIFHYRAGYDGGKQQFIFTSIAMTQLPCNNLKCNHLISDFARLLPAVIFKV